MKAREAMKGKADKNPTSKQVFFASSPVVSSPIASSPIVLNRFPSFASRYASNPFPSTLYATTIDAFDGSFSLMYKGGTCSEKTMILVYQEPDPKVKKDQTKPELPFKNKIANKLKPEAE